MVLLSASADNTMILWIPDSKLNGVWNSTVSLAIIKITIKKIIFDYS